MASGPRAITVPLSAPAATVAFQLPPNVTLDVQAVYVDIDATAGQADPELVVSAPSGVVIARKRQSGSVAAGGVGSATWALRLTDETPAAVAASLAWATAQVNPAAIPAGGAATNYFSLNTNDPAAFALDVNGFLVFNKAGVFHITTGFAVSTSVAGGPVANPWTTFVQGGSGTVPGTILAREGSGTTNGIFGSAAIQLWNCAYAYTMRVSAAQVGGSLNWNWNTSVAVTLQASGGVTVQELAP